MTLFEYLNGPGAPLPVRFAAAIGLQSDAAVRQWKGDANRKPSPEYVPAIEAVSKGAVRRWEMYPDAWWRIWPELVGSPGAPDLPEGAELVPALTIEATQP